MKYIEDIIQGNKLKSTCDYKEDYIKFMLCGEDIDTGKPINMPVGSELLSRHMMFLGGIGTGKSNAFNFVINNIRASMDNDDVMIIFDTKGDYYEKFYRPGDIVISNDKRATGKNNVDYWNLFKEVGIDDRLEENILEIATTLFEEKIKSSSQPFFPNAAKDIFAALMMHISRHANDEEHANNKYLRTCFDTFKVSTMKQILEMNKDLKSMSAYIEDEKSGQTLGVVSEMQQLVREIFVGNFKQKGNLSIREIVRNKGNQVVFVEYDLGIGQVLSPIYRIIFDLAIKEALCRTSNEGNVYFLLDEFRLLPHLKHIDDGVNFGRSLGAKFILGVQNIDQIYNAYGENAAKSILSGFGTNISFRVQDANSREYIKNLYGKNIKLQTYMSKVSSRGICENTREGYVVEDVDITNLRLGEAIIGIMSYEPFRFKFKRFFK